MYAAITSAFYRQLPYFFEWWLVLFGAGIALYFALPVEPVNAVAWGTGCAGMGALFFTLFPLPLRLTLRLGAALLLGFTLAFFHTHRHERPLAQTERIQTFRGILTHVERRPRTLRLTLQTKSQKVRLTTPHAVDFMPRVGDEVVIEGTLHAPSSALVPNGYDFQRHCFFEGIQGVGFSKTPPVFQTHPPCQGRGCAAEKLQNVRDHIRDRLDERLSSRTAGIAKALITGDRGGITKATQRLFAETGIAHILAISGLHFSLVTGFLFFLMRALLVAIPGLALRYPLKKWAAAGALVGAALYLLLSGMGYPTLRAFVMVACVMAGIALHRLTLSVRLLAIAALLILLWNPHALLSPSFQLSFAAVLALISAYQVYQRYHTPAETLLGRVRHYLSGLLYTSVIAWAATTPIALAFFQVLSPYAVLTNLWVVPWVGLVIMPLALAVVVLMPLGWDALLLPLFGWALDLLYNGTAWMHTWPGATATVAAPPSTFVMGFIVGGIFLCLWQGRGRWLGLLPIVLGSIGWLFWTPPDIYVHRPENLIAVRHQCPEGSCLAFSRAAYEGFIQRLWADHAGVNAFHLWPYPGVPPQGEDFTCDGEICGWRAPNMRVLFPKNCRTARHMAKNLPGDTHLIHRWADCPLPDSPQIHPLKEEDIGTFTRHHSQLIWRDATPPARWWHPLVAEKEEGESR